MKKTFLSSLFFSLFFMEFSNAVELVDSGKETNQALTKIINVISPSKKTSYPLEEAKKKRLIPLKKQKKF